MFSESQNPFKALGIEPAFEIDAAALDKAYFDRQMLAHPDRFIYHSEPERWAASREASALNRAYETLKNPLLRAKALLKLRGMDFSNEEGKTDQDARVLEEMMDLREALMEAVSPRDLKLVESQIHDRFQEIMTSFAKAWRQNKEEELPRLLSRLSYAAKMISDIKTRQRQSSIKVL